MSATLGRSPREGLERSCGDWVRSRGPIGGIELLQARFSQGGYAPHRHDTYGIGLTEFGVQVFGYRGSLERSLPGQVTVLHPDEKHDGHAGTDVGFGYHIVYVAPAEIGAAVRAITGRPMPLPFVPEPVTASPRLASGVRHAFGSGLEPLARDTLILGLAEGLLAADPALPNASKPRRLDLPALARVRDFLDSRHTMVRSAQLERVAGLSRYELARQFRMAYGTSPYRYSLLRRLDSARAGLLRGERPVEAALAAGFADQAHFSRMFGSTFGMPPGRYALLHGSHGSGQSDALDTPRTAPAR